MSVLDGLAAQLPARSLSVADADRLAVSCDLWPKHLIALAEGHAPQLPLGVVWPEGLEQLQRVVTYARAQGLTLVPYGAGSSVVGGATPNADQLVLDLKRMQRVLAIDTDARVGTVETGMLGELWERELNRHGFTQGHFPSSIYCSTVGGWIAARSAGQMSSRYGKIEDQVVGGTLVLGNGSVCRQASAPIRAPLFDLLVGAEGTLGVWAEASFRIHPLPEARLWRGIDFPDLDRALAAARELLVRGLSPCVLRIYDPLDTLLHRGSHGARQRGDRGPDRMAWIGAQLPQLVGEISDRVAQACRCVLGFEGEALSAAAHVAAALDVAGQHGGHDRGAAPGAQWYASRYAISYRQSNAFRAGVAVDTMEVACPWEHVRATYDAVRVAGRRQGAQVLAHFSHAYLEGCSIYFTFAMPVAIGTAGYHRLWEHCLDAAVAAGANVSHHHGTGRLKQSSTLVALGGARRALAQARAQLDPAGVLNPQLLSDEPSTRRIDRAAPPAQGAMVIAESPEEKVCDVEKRLNLSGRTLGLAARIFADATLLSAARHPAFLRRNPQLRTVESLVHGVEGRVDDIAYGFIPAPRAAMGPDLRARLLAGQVSRLWLRCQPTGAISRTFVGDPEEAVQVLCDLARNPVTEAVAAACWVVGERAYIEVAHVRDARANVVSGEVDRRMSYGFAACAAPAAVPVVQSSSRLVAATWAELERLTGRAVDWCLPWCDPVGAAGLVADEQVAQSLAPCVTEWEASEGRQSNGDSPSPDAGEAWPARESNEPVRARLRVAAHKAALDNCTYCPKLCRFSCPVAVAEGSETLTPRQLMLTANLHATSKRALSADAAARLWACVDCGGCRSFCEHDNDVATVLQDVRAQLYAQDAAPAFVRRYLEAIVRQGAPPDVTEWPARDVQQEGAGPEAPVWLFLGCQNTHADAPAAVHLLHLAMARYGKVHVAAPSIACCGQALWRWGDRRGFQAYARAFAAQFRGVRELVVDDPGCFRTLRVEYANAGVEMPQIVGAAELVSGRPIRYEPEVPWTWHEPCFGRQLDVRLELGRTERKVNGSVLGDRAGCCGGMLLRTYDAELAERVAAQQARDLTASGAARIVSGSPTCRRQLRSAGVEVVDAFTLWQP